MTSVNHLTFLYMYMKECVYKPKMALWGVEMRVSTLNPPPLLMERRCSLCCTQSSHSMGTWTLYPYCILMISNIYTRRTVLTVSAKANHHNPVQTLTSSRISCQVNSAISYRLSPFVKPETSSNMNHTHVDGDVNLAFSYVLFLVFI